MTRQDRVRILLHTYTTVRPDTPTWRGETAGETELVTLHPDEIRQLYRQGSYHELERALHSLQARRPACHRAVCRLHIHGLDLPGKRRKDADTGLADLVANRVFAAGVRVPPMYVDMWQHGFDFTRYMLPAVPGKGRHANPTAQRDRNERIRHLFELGKSPQAIADVMAISRRRVLQILSAQAA